jgi:hypothetical protein
MKAKRLWVETYEVEVLDNTGATVKLPYDVKKSISDIILAPPLKLNGVALLKNYKIASKILDCKDTHILLDFEEYGVILSATETLDVFSKNDVELIRRIHEVEEVEVKAK